MSIIRPYRPSWTYWNSTFPATPVSGNQGVSFTAGINDAKGSTASLFTVAADCEFLVVSFHGTNISTVAPQMLCDIMIDRAGGTSWETDPLVPNLIAGGRLQFNVNGGPVGQYKIPIFIPDGAAIGVRAQWGSGTAPTGTLCNAMVFGGNQNPGSWWCGQKVVAYGVDTATSAGTNVVQGASNAWGSWTNIGSVTEDDHMCFLAAAHSNQAATTAFNYNGQIGFNSSPIGGTFNWSCSTTEIAAGPNAPPVFQSVAAGTQLQARVKSSGAGQNMNIAIYGIS